MKERTLAPDYLLMKKEVDWSFLKEGFTIPRELHQKWYEAIGRSLNRGEGVDLTFVLDGKEHPVRLRMNRSRYDRDILQVRYSPASDLVDALRRIYRRGYDYLESERIAHPHQQATLPEQLKEYAYIYSSKDSSTFSISVH